MSCFICSDRHIATIAVAYSNLTGFSAQPIANELARINVESVNYRYDESTAVEPVDLTEESVEALAPHDLVALCECLDYQSCEPKDYKNPLLERITETFKAQVKHGIKSNVWSI